MCHNSVWEEEEQHDEQIDKCVENGMPQKIVKSLKFTIKKRIEKHKNENKQHDDEPKMVTSSSSYVEQMKCPLTKVGAEHIMHQQSVAAVASTKAPFIPQMCGRFRSSLSTSKADVKHGIANISGHNNSSHKLDQTFYTDDNLAKSVQFTRIWASRVYRQIRNLQNSRIYLLLTGTAQPAHVITIAILAFVLFAVWPELIGWKNTSQSSLEDNENGKYVNGTHRLAMVIYLGAFATHFGAQIWMTFVSGLSLYFSLPRHIFGQCQQILFPKYFTLNAVLSLTMLILFIKYFFVTWTISKFIQLCCLAATGLIEVVVRLYIAPSLLKLMHEKYRIEGSIGSGAEIGRLVQGDLTECPHYQRIHRAFRRLHMIVATGNIITLAASCAQLCYLAAQIQITI